MTRMVGTSVARGVGILHLRSYEAASKADLRKPVDFAILDGLGAVRVRPPSYRRRQSPAGRWTNPETILKSLLKGTEILC